MTNLTLEKFFQEIDNLTIEEKIELSNYLKKQIQEQQTKTKPKNLVESFQNSPLVGVDLDLDTSREFDNRDIEL